MTTGDCTVSLSSMVTKRASCHTQVCTFLVIPLRAWLAREYCGDWWWRNWYERGTILPMIGVVVDVVVVVVMMVVVVVVVVVVGGWVGGWCVLERGEGRERREVLVVGCCC